METVSFPRMIGLAVKIGGLAIAYFVAGKLSILLAIPPGYAAAVWPAAGIALSGILLYGYRLWPGIFLGSFFVYIGLLPDAYSPAMILKSLPLPAWIASGAAAQALISAFLINRFIGFPISFKRLGDIFKVLILGGPMGCLISATIGVTGLLIMDTLPWSYAANNWWTWWVGDTVGVLIFIPIISVWRMELHQSGLRSRLSAEERLKETQAELESRVEVRTIDLTQAVTQLEQEINDRKKSEKKLQESETRFRGLVESAPDAILIVNIDGRIVFANKQCEKLFGYEPNELMGQMHNILLPDRFKPIHQEHRLGYFRDPHLRLMGAGHDILSAWRRDGSEFPVEISLSPLRIEEKVQVISIIRDISDRMEKEKALRKSEASLAEAQRVAHLGSWDWDIQNNKLVWSDEMCRIFGTTQDQFGGTYEVFINTVHPDDRDDVQKSVDEALNEGKHYNIDFRILPGAGLERHVNAQGMVIHDEKDEPIRMFGTVLDITQRKRIEHELRVYQEQLEDRVEQRTAELKVAMKRAMESDQMKSAFLASMSHELRTPLNSIIGFTGILIQGLAGPLNAEQVIQLNMVKDSARHLLSLINDILDLSKIEAGELEINQMPFDMKEAIGKAIQTVTPLVQEAGLEIKIDVAENMTQVMGDQRRVEQILINLLNNSAKFTEKGWIRLSCAIEDDRLITSVEDTGIGISPENMNKLFRKFSQIDMGTNRSYEGTGLGLSICKKLIRIMGGKIWAESKGEGKGSKFTFTLPSEQ